MEELARLGLFITCLLAVYVGVRTLWIWRRLAARTQKVGRGGGQGG